MRNNTRAVNALRRAAKGHRIPQRVAIAALADLTDASKVFESPPPGATMVLLAFYQLRKELKQTPSVRELAARTGRGKSTIHDHLLVLLKYNLVKRTTKEVFAWRAWTITNAGKRLAKRLLEDEA